MKISRSQITPRQSGKTTTVYGYPSENGSLDVAYITVQGRHPDNPTKWYVNHLCDMVFYVLRGDGKFVIEDTDIPITQDDVVTVLKEQRYFIEGDLAYVVASSPAYSREQAETVDR